VVSAHQASHTCNSKRSCHTFLFLRIAGRAKVPKNPLIMKPTISAVIPAYNSAAFIGEAISSIRSQTHPVDEIIVVDDGSEDNTGEVTRQAGRDIRYIRQDNAGPSSARNRGIASASGDLIAFLDADDLWVPDRIERQLDVIRHNPEIVLVAGDMAEIDVQGRIIVPTVLGKHSMLALFRELGGSPIPNALALLMKINFIPTGSVLVSKSVLLATGSFNTGIRYGEDLELWGRIAASHAISCLPDVLMLRRQHGNNATRSMGPLLLDLVKVAESARSWGHASLLQSGVDPDRLVAQAWANLGYWHFTSSNMPQARAAFFSSLRERFNSRAAFYAGISLLPENIVNIMRQMKAKLPK